MDNIISKFKTHFSIVKIKKKFMIKNNFSVSPKQKDETLTVIKDLLRNKVDCREISLNNLKKCTFYA